MIDYLFITLLSIVTMLAIQSFCMKFVLCNKRIMYASLLYHTMFSVIYYYYSIEYGADSLGYYQVVTEQIFSQHEQLYGTGTRFIEFLLRPLVGSLGLSYFSCMMLFNVVGFFGLWFFYASVVENLEKLRVISAKKILAFIMFIPGLNFWSSAIGKDSLATFALGLLLLGVSRVRRIVVILIALVVIFHVRPHVFVFACISLGSAFVFARRMSRPVRLIYLLCLAAGLALATDRVQNAVGVEQVSGLDDILDVVESRGNYNLEHTSSYRIPQSNIPFRVITYLYRPLFVDAQNMTMFIVSFENIILVLLSIKIVLGARYLRGSIINDVYLKFCSFFFVTSILVLSSVTSNLGIAARQKYMALPFLFALYCVTQSGMRVRPRASR